jgi:putative FmdB family regulatory protein
MPLYEHQCGYCGARRDVMLKIAELDLTPALCTRCGQPMARLLSAPAVLGDYEAYDCPITGARIEGRRAHEENLAKHGCRVRETGETEEFMRRRKTDEERLDKAVGETAEAAVHEMPTRKREQLISEVQAGADVSYSRATPNN